MYSVRLLLRSFAKKGPCLHRRSEHSKSIKPKQRMRNLNQSDQLAGVRRQIAAMGYTAEEISEFDDLDDEVNTSTAEQIHDNHVSEVRWKDHKHTLAEYSQKYYKPAHEPPLLSMEDMKQIRHLHLEENWPFSALAKSFPASELIIKKVLKSKRNPSLQEEFEHDEKVAENWKLLRKGKLEISEELKQHCLKFTNRKVRPMTSKDLSVLNSKPSRPPGSFLNIVKPPHHAEHNTIEYQALRNKAETEGGSNPNFRYNGGNTFHYLQEKLSLEEARKRELEHLADQDIGPDEDVKAFVCGQGPSKDNSPDDKERENYINNKTYVEQSVATKEKSYKFVSKWEESSKSAKATRDALTAPIIDFPEKISIPETAKRPGAIYRVEDCFYNEDGEFMYRVPGLKF